MAPVVFRRLASQTNTLVDFLQRTFGATGKVVGDDIVVSDAAIDQMTRADVLRILPQIKLTKGHEAVIAGQLLRQVPRDFEKYAFDKPDKMLLSEGYGLLSEMNRINSLLAISEEATTIALLRDELLPFMIEKLNASFVTGVVVDATLQQAWISFSKIAMLIGKYPPAEVTERIQNRALDGVLPDSLSPLSFLEALTRFSPLMFTLPIRQLGCSWHFQSSAMWSLPSAVATGFVSEFTIGLNPLAEDSHIIGLQGLSDMSEANIWKYLRFCVAGLNRLLRYLNDPRSFASPTTGEVDLVTKVQAYGTTKLLFADLLAMNFTPAAHNRVSYAMSALDKLANLRVHLGRHASYGEEIAMAELASESQASELKSTIGRSMTAMNYGPLANMFDTVVDRCYTGLHQHLGSQSKSGARSEKARLTRIRSQRNLRHGAFLRKNQFEDVFFDSAGTLPSAIATLPFILVLGLLASPRDFFSFRPIVAS